MCMCVWVLDVIDLHFIKWNFKEYCSIFLLDPKPLYVKPSKIVYNCLLAREQYTVQRYQCDNFNSFRTKHYCNVFYAMENGLKCLADSRHNTIKMFAIKQRYLDLNKYHILYGEVAFMSLFAIFCYHYCFACNKKQPYSNYPPGHTHRHI